MMYEILFSNQFKRSYKKCLKRGCDKALFEEVVTLLAETGTLPQRYKAHKLTGQWKGFGSVISNQIGYSFGNNAKRSWY